MLEQIQIPAWKCKCDTCKHEWISTREKEPTHCPSRNCPNPTKWNSGGTKQKHETHKPISEKTIIAKIEFQGKGEQPPD